jgi:tetratricopeptide (TPR) repeat protein
MARGHRVAGHVIPAPGRSLPLSLYSRDGAPVDNTICTEKGEFQFLNGARSGVMYELRVQLSDTTEFVKLVSFSSSGNTVRIDNPFYIRGIAPDNKPKPGATVSVASLMAPQKAVEEFDKGRELAAKKKFEESLQHLANAVEIYPGYPDAYNEMGAIHRDLGHVPEAVQMFQKAIDADPKWTEPYVNLAQIQLSRNEFADMLKTTGKALELDPNLAPLHFFQAVAYLNANDLDGAEKEATLAAQDRAKPIAQAQMILGNVAENRGNKAEAIEHYRLFVKLAPASATAPRVTAHIAELEKELKPQKFAQFVNP